MASGAPLVIPSWTPNCLNSEKQRWVCIYPAYLNSKKTIAEGRRIPKDKCVENPTVPEIQGVLTAAGLNCIAENKLYNRERSKELPQRGRIRVQLKNDDGSLFSEEFPDKETVMIHVARMIPKLKTRQPKADGHGAGGGGGKKGKGKGRR